MYTKERCYKINSYSRIFIFSTGLMVVNIKIDFTLYLSQCTTIILRLFPCLVVKEGKGKTITENQKIIKGPVDF